MQANIYTSACAVDGGVDSGFVFDFHNGDQYNGRSFPVVDSNGDGKYTPGTDHVIEVTNHTGTFTSGDFI